MMGWKQAFSPEGMRRMGEYMARQKAGADAALAKADAPCDLPGRNGEHEWQYLRGEFGGLRKQCNCGALKS
jgi:hypothetical protein